MKIASQRDFYKKRKIREGIKGMKIASQRDFYKKRKIREEIKR
jgi:hypothetical protein